MDLPAGTAKRRHSTTSDLFKSFVAHKDGTYRQLLKHNYLLTPKMVTSTHLKLAVTVKMVHSFDLTTTKLRFVKLQNVNLGAINN